MERESNWWHRLVVAEIAALALALFLGLVGGCASPPTEEPVLPSPTGIPAATDPHTAELNRNVASEPVACAPEGVAAAAEAGREGPYPPESSTPAPPTIPAETVIPTEPVATAAASPDAAGPRRRVIALDPGHGGPESGASAVGLAEKEVNLAIALKLAELLRAEGYDVVLTRDTDRSVSPEFRGGGYPGVGIDLQARIDIANAASADLFLSIHNNGSADPTEQGTEVWYSKERPFAERNLTLAALVEENLLEELAAIGYAAQERGIKDDSTFRIFRGRAYNIYVLGPGTGPRGHVPTQMPGVLGESLFVSNPRDAQMLRQERTLDAIAEGYRNAVVAYFERYPDPLP